VLNTVCEHVVRLLPGADHASVTLDRSGSPSIAASTSAAATRLERRQYLEDDGPCLTAARTNMLVRGAVEEIKDTWPGFAEEALDAGVHSFLGAPMVVEDGVSGALNLFGTQPHGFRYVDVTVLDLFTTTASAMLRMTSRYSQAVEVISQLDRALATRAAIEQAKGILMATHRTSEDAAFRMLVDRSQAANKKLHLIAQEFVANASREG
jgi:transcriptional regulator with GAF, ATPase, and Fis domain